MKFQTPSGNVLEINITYFNCQKNGSGYMYAKLKKREEPYVSYDAFNKLLPKAEIHAEKEFNYAQKLKMDAPNSSTYAAYRFYTSPSSDPDLKLLKSIQAQMKEFDDKNNFKIEQSSELFSVVAPRQNTI
jgi:hypothetical protein